jgi:uncharacterized protein YerC
MAKLEKAQVDPMHAELIAIKQLLIIALLRDGVQQSQIAAATGTSDAKLSRTFPKGLLKSLKHGRDEEN